MTSIKQELHQFKNKFIKLSTLFFALFAMSQVSHADTIDHYMNIANNIPKMEMKADEQAQAWARSARNVLAMTCESILETMIEMNNIAKQQGRPLFCKSNNQPLNAQTLNQLIQQTAKDLNSKNSGPQQLTVSQVAWMAVKKNYPCQGNNSSERNSPYQQLSNISINHQSGYN